MIQRTLVSTSRHHRTFNNHKRRKSQLRNTSRMPMLKLQRQNRNSRHNRTNFNPNTLLNKRRNGHTIPTKLKVRSSRKHTQLNHPTLATRSVQRRTNSQNPRLLNNSVNNSRNNRSLVDLSNIPKTRNRLNSRPHSPHTRVSRTANQRSRTQTSSNLKNLTRRNPRRPHRSSRHSHRRNSPATPINHQRLYHSNIHQTKYNERNITIEKRSIVIPPSHNHESAFVQRQQLTKTR